MMFCLGNVIYDYCPLAQGQYCYGIILKINNNNYVFAQEQFENNAKVEFWAQ